MINPHYFRDRILITAFSITPDGHEINHINPKNTIKQSYSEIEKIYVIKILKEMAENFARLMNQYIYIYENQTVFSAKFDKQDEYDQVLDEIELYNNLNTNKNSTESDLDNTDSRYRFAQQIQNHETKESGWRFDNIS